MPHLHHIVLGTHNRKKGDELQTLLAPLGITLRTLADIPHARRVVEDGQSFAENAQKKAREQAMHLHEWVIAEDSGLCVPALGGAPGIYSARYAGPDATDEENNARLLREMADIPDEQRGAYYVCHIALSDPQGQIRIAHEAQCHGRLTREPRGHAGFGYDPLFEIVEYHRTFAELGETVKGAISHRARATRRLIADLARLAAEQG